MWVFTSYVALSTSSIVQASPRFVVFTLNDIDVECRKSLVKVWVFIYMQKGYGSQLAPRKLTVGLRKYLFVPGEPVPLKS